MTNHCDAIYTVCVGSGLARYMQIPEEGYIVLSRARRVAATLRAEGYRDVYVLNHVTGATDPGRKGMTRNSQTAR